MKQIFWVPCVLFVLLGLSPPYGETFNIFGLLGFVYAGVIFCPILSIRWWYRIASAFLGLIGIMSMTSESANAIVAAAILACSLGLALKGAIVLRKLAFERFYKLAFKILKDDKVDKREAVRLQKFLSRWENKEVRDYAEELYAALKETLDDGVLDEFEAEKLRSILSEIIDIKTSGNVVTFEVDAGRPNDRYFLISYEDAKGNTSEREIAIRSVTQKNDVAYLNAYCRTRKAYRTFRLDRIVSAVNIETGEVVDEMKVLLNE